MEAVDQTLFRELKGRYPELPDHILTSCMTRFKNDREKCMETLTQESPKYLFDEASQNSTVNEHIRGINDMKISEPRPRSDSTGSNRSNASTGSGSASRPPFHASHSLINVPGYRGPINLPSDDHPLTAPVNPSAINQFIDFYGSEQNPHNIPNINCNNSSGGASYGMNYGAGHGHSGNSPPSHTQHQPGLRQLEVHHIQTNPTHTETANNYSQPSYLCQIMIDPTRGAAAASPVMQNSQPYPTTPNRNTWGRQPNVQSGYQTSSNAAFSDLRSYQYTNYPQSFTSPTEERSMGHGMSQPAYNQYGTHSSPQHSSQATIYLSNPASNQGSQYNTPTRANHSTMPGQYTYLPINCAMDPGLSPSYNRNSVGYGHGASGASPQPSGKGLSRPILVEIKSSSRDNTGVQSQINFFNNMSNTGQSEGGQKTLHKSSVIGYPSQNTDCYVPDTQSAYVDRIYQPECPTVISVAGATSTSQDEREFLQFPPMPNVCRVPGHPHGPIKSASKDSDSAFGTDLDFRQVARPFVSPASSQSSLSSESSPAIRDRQRSGSIQDDPEYTQALLTHQKSRMNKLREDVTDGEIRLQQLTNEVTDLEKTVIERKRKRKEKAFPSSVDLAKLRGENLQLQADIQLMTREIDLYNNGQTPLGVLDPLEQQNFYKNMNTGQRGSIYGSTAHVPPRTVSSTVTTVVTSTVTTPTRPPPDIPPILPPRERSTGPPPLPPRSVTPATVPPPPPHQPTVGSGDSDQDGEQWSCSACTFLNHPALNKCECCEMPRSSQFSSSSEAASAAVSSSGDIPDTYPSPGQIPQST